MSPNQDLPRIELKVFNSGWVPAREKMVIDGGGKEMLRLPALFAMVRHPEQGVVLYDTGYNTRFYAATKSFPFSILARLTPAEITEDDNAVVQLEKAGVHADEVKTIILGHGHVDHVPGIFDFPEAKVVVEHREWALMQKPQWRIFRSGYVKSLYEGLTNDIQLVDFETHSKPGGPFEVSVDLFDDGSMILVPLPGHTLGQMGLLVNTPDKGGFFFIGDAAWISNNFLEVKGPSRLARTILSSPTDFMATLHLLRDFYIKNSEATIVPSHCPQAWEKLQSMGMAFF